MISDSSRRVMASFLSPSSAKFLMRLTSSVAFWDEIGSWSLNVGSANSISVPAKVRIHQRGSRGIESLCIPRNIFVIIKRVIHLGILCSTSGWLVFGTLDACRNNISDSTLVSSIKRSSNIRIHRSHSSKHRLFLGYWLSDRSYTDSMTLLKLKKIWKFLFRQGNAIARWKRFVTLAQEAAL